MCHSTKCHNDVGHGANIRKPRSMKLTKHNGFMRDLMEYIFPVTMLECVIKLSGIVMCHYPVCYCGHAASRMTPNATKFNY